MSLLFGLSFTGWAAQSGLSSGNINDHAMKALQDLTGTTSDINNLMLAYLVSQGLTGSLSDVVAAWDLTFDDILLLESGDFLLVEDGNTFILE